MTRALLLFSALGALAVAGDARAAFQLCNKTGQAASVAVGYLDSVKGWTAQGWSNIPDGQCATVVAGPLGGAYAYVLIDRAIMKPAAGQKGGWFCTSERGFLTRNNDYADADRGLQCEAAGLRLEQFRQITLNGANATLNLR
ncbi:hypothetical protein BH10PSE9_BH10PSE9_21070 [soil metagenome]